MSSPAAASSSESGRVVVLASHSPSLYNTFSSYNELRRQRIEEESKQQIRQKNDVVFGLTWMDSDDGNGGNDKTFMLMGCTGSGDLVAWEVPSSRVTDGTRIDFAKPIFRASISNGKLYSIHQKQVGKKHLIFACGDEGVLMFDWHGDMMKTLRSKPNSNKASPSSLALKPVATFKPHPSPLEGKGIEINEIHVLQASNDKNYLFGAAGDSFGCYKWDLETTELIRTYSSPGRGHLCSIQVVQSPDDDNCNLLLLGGEDGMLTIWDLENDKRVGHIDLNSASSADIAASGSSSATASTSNSGPSRKRSRNMPSRWISSVCARDRNWWIVGGGSNDGLGGGPPGRSGGSSGKMNGGGGFLAAYHASTRSLIAWAETRETPQQLISIPSSAEASILSPHNLVSVANEGVVSHWDALSLDSEKRRRLWCTPPSGYAAAVSPNGLYTAIGGVGCFVDIFDHSGEKSLRLSII